MEEIHTQSLRYPRVDVHGALEPRTEDVLGGSELVARIDRKDLNPPAFGALRHLSLRVIRDPHLIQTLAYLVKNKWNAQGKIQINKHWASTFLACFSEETNFLHFCDRTWEMELDSPLLMRRAPHEVFHLESFNSIPQWGIIGNLSPSMFSKKCITVIMSTLGFPMDGKLLATARHLSSLRACFHITHEFHYPTSTKILIWEDGNQTKQILSVAYRSRICMW